MEADHGRNRASARVQQLRYPQCLKSKEFFIGFHIGDQILFSAISGRDCGKFILIHDQ